MTSTDNPTGSLTRRQLRELRETGQTPVLTTDGQPETPASPVPPRRDHADASLPPFEAPAEPKAAAEPDDAGEAPVAADGAAQAHTEAAASSEAEVDHAAEHAHGAHSSDDALADEHSPHTRREAREQERARTDSVSTIDDAAHAEAAIAESPSPRSPWAPPQEAAQQEQTPAFWEPAVQPTVAAEPAPADELAVVPAPEESEPAAAADVPAANADEQAKPIVADSIFADVDVVPAATPETAVPDDGRPQLRQGFGAAVLAEEAEHGQAGSFDQLLVRDRSTSGAGSAGSALILASGDPLISLTAPVTSTGQTLVTGSFNLPAGLGSVGHAPGTTDGKEVDAVLIDGELPPASSPTPIAATAAVSQAKVAGEIITPPAPEKSNKLMMVLAITAAGLALALAAVVIVAVSSGMLG